MLEADLKSLREFLCEKRVLSLSTSTHMGETHTVSLYYASDDSPSLFFCSASSSEHSQYILEQPKVSFSVFDDPGDPQLIRGVQGIGRCEQLNGERARAARDLFKEKFQFITKPKFKLAEVFKLMDFYKISLEQICQIDNRFGFGNKREWKI